MKTLFFYEKESKYLLFTLGISYLINFYLFMIFAFFTGFMCFFYRIPNINYNSNKNIISSPCSGKIIKIQENNNSYKLYIFMSLLDPHIQINPTNGIITKYEYISGKFLIAYNLENDNYRSRFITHIKNKNGIIEIIQNTGYLTRRIKNFHGLHNTVYKGDLLGIIKFGSRIDITIPKSYDLIYKLNDHINIGNSIAVITPKDKKKYINKI